MVFRVFGVTEDAIRAHVATLANPKLRVLVTENALDCRVEVIEKGWTAEQVSELVSAVAYPFTHGVYAFEDVSLAECAFRLLERYNLRISFGESLTGGALTSAMVDIAGVSKYLYEGIVAYDSCAKVRRLNVAESTLLRYSAVSYQTAAEMVSGLLNEDVDVAVSTTGYAGSSNDTAKPAGTFFVGVGNRDNIAAYGFFAPGTRARTRAAAVNAALFCLVKTLEGNVLDLVLLEEELATPNGEK